MDKHESYADYECLLLCLHLCIFLAIFADRKISSPADDLISLTEVRNHSLIPETCSPFPQCMHEINSLSITVQTAAIHITEHKDFEGKVNLKWDRKISSQSTSNM